MSDITIGFYNRERFSLAPESLQRIVDYSTLPYNLIVVDPNTPQQYWQEIKQILESVSNAEVIHLNKYVTPSVSANLILNKTNTKYLCLIQNDCLVHPEWLSRFYASIKNSNSDVVIPLLFDGRPGTKTVHFDHALGYVKEKEVKGEIKRFVDPRPGNKNDEVNAKPRFENFMETHCLFFRTEILKAVGGFDPLLNTSEEVDISMSLMRIQAKAWFDPNIKINFVHPPEPVCTEDRDYFAFKWDLKKSRNSHERIKKKWNFNKMPQGMGFVEERYMRGLGILSKWKEEIIQYVSTENPFILVDLAYWTDTPVTQNLNYWPFLEHDGKYWGAPKDDEEAINELMRMKNKGATHIVFTWHAFWYFDFYKSFSNMLSENYKCIVKNDHVIIYDLQK